MENFIKFYRIGFVAVVVLMIVFANMCWNTRSNDEKDFLTQLSLKLTLKVQAIRPTGNHGYGVIFGKLISSNTPPNYSAIYHNKYTFCKIEDNHILFVSDYYVMEKNDSVIVNSSVLKYWVYRKGTLVSEYNLTCTTDDFFYEDLEKNKYLYFDTYRNTN